MTEITFPKDFLWGLASSAYQIEGGWDEDGRSPSIWDTFSHTPGKIRHDENGDFAIDHYHLWKKDIEMMAEMGVPAYRFSTSWSRILPDGFGKVNPKGIGFYDRLIDELLKKKVEPWLCLYHWDLPQCLQDKGGWADRSLCGYFAEYAGLMAQKFSDRVKTWITHNEPAVTAGAGYLLGDHAPGIKDPGLALKVVHHLLLSHGLAYASIQANSKSGTKTGIVLNLTPAYPATNSEKDRKAVKWFDLLHNQLFLEPILLGTTPLHEAKSIKKLIGNLIQPDDLELIHKADLVGINYYTRAVIKHNARIPFIQLNQMHPLGAEYSGMWEIYPEGLFDLIHDLWQKYTKNLPADKAMPELYITENGVCVPDGLDMDGRVRDERRIRYLRSHLHQVHRLITSGVPLKGYFHWSFMDNFEWTYGYDMRFGLVHVDFATQKRVIKDSGYWYSQVVQKNGFVFNP